MCRDKFRTAREGLRAGLDGLDVLRLRNALLVYQVLYDAYSVSGRGGGY